MFYILIFVLFVFSELLYFKIADKFNIIDKPNERSSHSIITLRGGGIIFFIGALTCFSITGFQYPWFFLGLCLISLISFIDDITSVSSRIRLIMHFGAMLLLFFQLNIYNYPWFYWIFALVICTGIINAFNFMDGINGITGGYSFVVLASFFYINNYYLRFIDNDYIIIPTLSVLVFNFFNFRKKAKCFSGDIGAVSIAFIILFLLGKLVLLSNNFAFVGLLLVYGIDSILTIIHRILLKENIGLPHRKHLYQIMANELKIPHVLVSLVYMSIQVLFFIGLVYFISYSYSYLLICCIILVFVYILFMKKYFHLHIK
jgi:UDP-N-acetylmuramyl pentapeptide phosphotransferase/UDP-N-acetylglucosamine-1-phosphate transferase